MAPDEEQYPLCPRCQTAMDWDDCWQGCDEGYTHAGELFDMDPLWYDEDDVRPCHICEGKGGWYRCWDRECRERALEAS